LGQDSRFTYQDAIEGSLLQPTGASREQEELNSPPVEARPLTLRPVTEADEPFLFALYSSTRAMEMALVDWPVEQQQSFLQMQFGAQQEHYGANFPLAEHKIILLDQEAVGRIYVDRAGDEIRLLDITITPEARNGGIGRQLMGDLQAEATVSGRPVRFYVWQLNHDAQRFYRRLGFEEAGEAGAYIAMEWRPAANYHGGQYE
jgi:ribosomal protein S18 acetylase RimI-like enzyme